MVADALSRVSLEDNETDVIAAMQGVMTSVINYAAMAAQQGADAAIQRVVSGPNCSLQLTRCALPDTDERLLVDMSTGRPRPLVPAVLQGLYLMLITNCLTLERGRCDDWSVTGLFGLVCRRIYANGLVAAYNASAPK